MHPDESSLEDETGEEYELVNIYKTSSNPTRWLGWDPALEADNPLIIELSTEFGFVDGGGDEFRFPQYLEWRYDFIITRPPPDGGGGGIFIHG